MPISKKVTYLYTLFFCIVLFIISILIVFNAWMYYSSVSKKEINDTATKVEEYIKDHEGFTPLNDKSAAEDIYDAFGVSKKTFKKAVGDLYKKRLVVLEAEGIRLT